MLGGALVPLGLAFVTSLIGNTKIIIYELFGLLYLSLIKLLSTRKVRKVLIIYNNVYLILRYRVVDFLIL